MMIRRMLIAAIGSVLLGCLPAQAQDMPELDGAPGPLKIPKAAPAQSKPAPVQSRPPQSKISQPKAMQPKATTPASAKPSASAAQLQAIEDRLAKQADAQSAEAARLARQAGDLKVLGAALEARAADLAAAEKRLFNQRTEQEAALAAKQAELDRKLAAASQPAPGRQLAARDDDTPVPPRHTPPGRSDRTTGLDFETAKRSCALEAQAEARARNYVAASYDTEPRLNTRTMELRGLVRLDDRRGYRLVDSVCELSPDGDAEYFEFLR